MPRPTARDYAAYITASLLLLFAAATAWSRVDLDKMHRFVTPFDFTPVSNTHLWYFLTKIQPCVPKGARVVVVGKDPAEEHELYVLAVPIFHNARPRPASYFGTPRPEFFSTATYIVAYGDRAPPSTRGLRLVCAIPEGAVYRK